MRVRVSLAVQNKKEVIIQKQDNEWLNENCFRCKDYLCRI